MAALITVPLAGPALATHQQSTATVDARQVVAGSSDTAFNLAVAHPAGAGDAINWILAIPPQSTTGTELITATGGSAAGWSTQVVSPPSSVLFTNGSLAAGGSASIRVVGNATAPSADACGAWRVLVSSDGGNTTYEARAASSDSLTTCVRVVVAADVSLVAPTGAQDGTVTAGQANACLRVRFENRGSGDVVVVPSLKGSGFTSGMSRGVVEGEVPCSGPLLNNGEIGVSSGASGFADFEVTFAAVPGGVEITGSATGPTAKAVERVLSVTVEPRAELQYAAESLAPRAVRPGQEDVSFQISLLKTPEDSPAVRFDPTLTRLTFPGCVATPLIYPTSVVSESATQLVFERCDIGTVSDGSYDVAATYRYVDANGFEFESSLTGLERVKIDGLAPSGTASLAAPSGQPGVKDGDRLSFSGSIVDYDSDANNFVPCANCAVMVFIRQYAESSCATPAGPFIALSVTNDGGSIDEQYSGAYASGVRGVLAEMLVFDEAGNSSFIGSSCMLVDNERPVISKVETIRVGSDQNRLRVSLSECVSGRVELFDFRITNNVVLESTQPACIFSNGVMRTVLTLTTLVPFPDDDPVGTVRYEPLMSVGGSLRDAVGNGMVPHEAPIEDGIHS